MQNANWRGSRRRLAKLVARRQMHAYLILHRSFETKSDFARKKVSQLCDAILATYKIRLCLFLALKVSATSFHISRLNFAPPLAAAVRAEMGDRRSNRYGGYRDGGKRFWVKFGARLPPLRRMDGTTLVECATFRQDYFPESCL